MFLATLTLAALPVAAAPANNGGVVWHDGALSNAVGKAAQEEKLVMLYFWRDGSEYCAKLWHDTLSSEKAQGALGDVVCYSANHGTAQGAKLFEKFNVETLPSMVFLLPDGSPEDMIGGYIPAEDFVGEVARIRRAEGTVSGLRAAAARAAEEEPRGEADLKARYALADRLLVLGQEKEHAALVASIRADDPRGLTVPGARVQLDAVYRHIAEAGGGKQNDEHWDLEPLRAHLETVKPKEVRYEGWVRFGDMQAKRSNIAAACDGYEQAWSVCPEDKRMSFAADIAAYLMKADGERTPREQKLIVELAEACAELAEAYGGCGGECACYSCEDLDGTRAKYVSILAKAYHHVGKDKKARHVAERCVELDPDGGYEELVARIMGDQGDEG